MKKLKIGINGFGRIGRNAARIILKNPLLELAAINSRADAQSHAYLLKYDSNYGTYDLPVDAGNNFIKAGNEKIAVLNALHPEEIPWGDFGVDLVIDSTGLFRTKESLKGHLKNGVKYAVLSSPAKDDTKTIVMGVNHNTFSKESDKVVSNSSCTTNCLAIILKVINSAFEVEKAFMTTTHAVTDSQNLLDNSHKKEVRLRRAAFMSMIPASTGSAKDIVKLYPDLKGKISCQAIRVPLSTVSIINLVLTVNKKTTKDEINLAYLKSSRTDLKGILDVAPGELVSVDYKGSPYSAVFDKYLTDVIDGHFINLYAWYDNEWGYTSRLVDLVSFIAKKAGLI